MTLFYKSRPPSENHRGASGRSCFYKKNWHSESRDRSCFYKKLHFEHLTFYGLQHFTVIGPCAQHAFVKSTFLEITRVRDNPPWIPPVIFEDLEIFRRPWWVRNKNPPPILEDFEIPGSNVVYLKCRISGKSGNVVYLKCKIPGNPETLCS